MPNVYEIVTDRIIKVMESGVAPWQKPWVTEAPMNLVSQREYSGLNVFMLASQGFGSKYWLTFTQAQKLGGTIRKGEKSSMVIFWKVRDFTKMNVETQELEDRKSAMLRYYDVFNLSQTEGIAEKLGLSTAVTRTANIEACESIIASMRNAPKLAQHHRAAYSPTMDTVLMPERTAFNSLENFYSTYFHELTHSTGHVKRLNRFDDGVADHSFGSESYSKEELVAELGAAMLSGVAGIAPAVTDHSAAYLKAWIERLKSDSKLIISAASAAQKAADYIRGISKTEAE